MSFKQLRVTAIIALLALMTACAPKKPTSEFPWSLNINNTQTKTKAAGPKQHANTLTHWEIRGAMAAHNNKKGWTATFNWIQRGIDEYQIRLFGPLGGGTVLINKKNGLITYRDGQHISSSHNANSLLKQKTGIALPVANLYYWARGLPAPGQIKSIKYDSFHHLQSFKQADYTIEYLSTMNVNGMDLPKKIRLQGNGIMIKVAIKNWKF